MKEEGGKRDLPLRFGRSVGRSVLGPLSSSSVYVFASPLSSFFPGTNRRSLPPPLRPHAAVVSLIRRRDGPAVWDSPFLV